MGLKTDLTVSHCKAVNYSNYDLNSDKKASCLFHLSIHVILKLFPQVSFFIKNNYESGDASENEGDVDSWDLLSDEDESISSETSNESNSEAGFL